MDNSVGEYGSCREMKARICPIIKQILLLTFLHNNSQLGRYEPSSPTNKELHY